MKHYGSSRPEYIDCVHGIFLPGENKNLYLLPSFFVLRWDIAGEIFVMNVFKFPKILKTFSFGNQAFTVIPIVSHPINSFNIVLYLAV